MPEVLLELYKNIRLPSVKKKNAQNILKIVKISNVNVLFILFHFHKMFSVTLYNFCQWKALLFWIIITPNLMAAIELNFIF